MSDVKISHSVFALPFALLASCMAFYSPFCAQHSFNQFLVNLLFICVAMVTARTAAMLSNRIFDRDIDATNPRTESRPLAAQQVDLSVYIIALAMMVIVFMVVALLFWLLNGNPWPFLLSAPILIWICAYGLFKRFTALCHIWLGASLALSVPAAALAVQPESLQMSSVWLLAGMVLCWVAGFDVIYALQDVEVDRAEGLHSMPSRFGVGGAMWVSRSLHLAAVILLVMVWWEDARFGSIFLVGVVLATLLLVIEHLTVHRWGATRMAISFFMLNGVVSCLLGLTGIIDLLSAR